MLDLLQTGVRSVGFDGGVSCAVAVGCDAAGVVDTKSVRACVVATNAFINDATAYAAFHTTTGLKQHSTGLLNTAIALPYAADSEQLTAVKGHFSMDCVAADRTLLGSRLVYHIVIIVLLAAARDVG